MTRDLGRGGGVTRDVPTRETRKVRGTRVTSDRMGEETGCLQLRETGEVGGTCIRVNRDLGSACLHL